MTAASDGRGERWIDAMIAARLFAGDPLTMGGIVVRARAGPLRDRWLANLRSLLPPDTSVRKLPPGIDEERLLGGVDLAATLAAGKPVARAGLLAESAGGVLIVPMAERLASGTAVQIAAAVGTLGAVLIDEGADEEAVPAILTERCALHLDLSDLSLHDTGALAAAPAKDEEVSEEEAIAVLCATAASFGIGSARPPLQALKVARGLSKGGMLRQSAIARAARLSLAPRALALPELEAEPPPPEPPQDVQEREPGALREMVVDAVRAALPPGLLAALAAKGAKVRGRRGAAIKRACGRGRPAGVRRGLPRSGERLSIVATLRAAAPWQRVRTPVPGARIRVARDDLRVRRTKPKGGTSAIFVLDASGSAAAERMAEAKGAIELLLTEAYASRAEVALIGFRGTAAELVLPATRSLARARRCLAGMVGGGGTPVAAALVAARDAATLAASKGRTPSLIVMTDGRANVALDGSGGRERAVAESLAAANAIAADGHNAVLVDIGALPRPEAAALAKAMAARYLALPRADAGAIAAALQ